MRFWFLSFFGYRQNMGQKAKPGLSDTYGRRREDQRTLGDCLRGGTCVRRRPRASATEGHGRHERAFRRFYPRIFNIRHDRRDAHDSLSCLSHARRAGSPPLVVSHGRWSVRLYLMSAAFLNSKTINFKFEKPTKMTDRYNSVGFLVAKRS